MNVENDQWNNADEEFGLWLNGNKQEGNLTLTEILKSAYLVFRKEQRIRLETFCKKSFDYFKEKEKEKLANFLKYGDTPSMYFSKSEPEPGYYERLRREENEKIIKGILSGKQQIFNELYEYEFPKVVQLIKKNSGNLDKAKDVFQEALLILIEKANRVELNLTCSIKTYLYSICRILWLEQLRKDKRNISLDDSYNHCDINFVITNYETVSDIYDDVNNAIEKLGEPCKQLLECFYYKKMSWDEIANTLGYKNAASARNQKYKYLERIRSTVSFQTE